MPSAAAPAFFAVGLAQKLGMRRICFPAMAAVFSAFGSSTLDVRHQYEEIVQRKDASAKHIDGLLAASFVARPSVT